MNFSKLVILLGLMVCLIAPASAWEQSFENHPKDVSTSLFVGGTILADDHGYARSNVGTNFSMDIKEPWTGDISYSVKLIPSGGSWIWNQGIKIYNADGTLCLDYHLSPTSNTYAYHRIEIAESTTTQGINVYCDGVLAGSSSYTTTPDYAGHILITSYNSNSGSGTIWIDDICSTSQMISCDSSVSISDSGQYYKTSYSAYTGTSWYSTITSPNGTTLKNTVNSINEQLIPISWFNDSGTYLIKLYQDDGSGHGTPLASRSFTFGKPDFSLLLDKVNYVPGDTMTISAYSKNYAGWSVEIPYYDKNGALQTHSFNLTSSDQTEKFTLPTTSRGGSFIATLKDSYGGVKQGVQYSVLASGGLTSLTINKATYAPLDVVIISYSNMPSNTVITISVQNGNRLVTSNSWSGVVGSGVVTYTIPTTTADNFIVSAASGTTALGQTTGTIISGIYYLYGHIIDPSDNSLIPGATIQVGTASTVSDSNGAFNFTVPVGWQTLTITKTGYQSNINKVNIVYKSAKQDFYLVKSYSGSGHSIYGLVTNYYTGAPVTSAYITISQGSASHSTFSYSGSGYYIFDSADLTGNWTVKVSKTGFYGYTSTVTVSGDTYKQIILTPLNYSSTGDTGTSADTEVAGTDSAQGSTGSSSSSTIDTGGTSSTDASVIDSTGVSSDRPGREAAKGTMEELEATVPSLIGFVVLMAFIKLFESK